MGTLLIKNIGLLATSPDSFVKKGEKQKDILLLKDAYVLCEDDRIKTLGNGNDLPEADEVIDAEGKLVTPGLVDAHTHLIFGGWRQNEMAMKLAGAGYLDILNAGGGILSTVRQTRNRRCRRSWLSMRTACRCCGFIRWTRKKQRKWTWKAICWAWSRAR